jgi:hypothetical protein
MLPDAGALCAETLLMPPAIELAHAVQEARMCFDKNVCSYKVAGVTIHLAGVPVQDDLILELARMVDDDALATKLETAFGRMTRVLALTIPEREAILAAMGEVPAGLEELHGVLLREAQWRRAEGL